MLESLTTLYHALLILLGFGLMIAMHELGHFLAARWAGIRVDAFAVGMGPALLSYRKGMGLRRGSSEAAYQNLLRSAKQSGQTLAISPTEYRLNAIPLGGYVKMLGQEDLTAVQASTDTGSFMAKPVWKRMVVISAGVVMNLLLAAALFVVVFMSGLRLSSAAIGPVVPGSPAAQAGLRPGDVVVSIDGTKVDHFGDVMIAAAMASRGKPLQIMVSRPGEPELVRVSATPQLNEQTGLLMLGVGMASGVRVVDASAEGGDPSAVRRLIEYAGLRGVEPGSTLVAVNGRPLEAAAHAQEILTLTPLLDALRRGAGEPVAATFQTPSGERTTIELRPRPMLQRSVGQIDVAATASFEHLLGMVPVTRLQPMTDNADAAGLRAGDLLARVGSVEWPSIPDAIAQVRQHAGKRVELAVLRPVDGDATAVDRAAGDRVVLNGRAWELVQLTAPVNAQGQVGMQLESAVDLPLIARAPRLARDPATGEIPADLPVERLFPRLVPGMLLVSIDGQPVGSFAEARDAVVAAAATLIGQGPDAGASEPDAGGPIELRLGLGMLGGSASAQREREHRTIELFAEDARAIADLGWDAERVEAAFMISSVLVKADNPLGAMAMGVRETVRRVKQVYVTIRRLFEGTVQARHLSGPIGITHIGSKVSAMGPMYLLNFLALISANLAVINFLPLPILDGGHIMMLLYEWIRGKPVPVAAQNLLNLIGLVLIAGLFLVVTYYDILGLFTR
jgi:regulator of sigma E protease